MSNSSNSKSTTNDYSNPTTDPKQESNVNQQELTDLEVIEIYGAREHNLKNISLTLPRNKLVVITGVSGSGKSSLAFDTIYAEGQRRYLETFSSYIRQFVGGLERPDVDKISGLSPVIAIDQKTTSRNPRSTVGTVTEIYDFFRLLFSKISDAYSYTTGKKMVKISQEEILESIYQKYLETQITILAPIVRGRKGSYREEFEKLIKQGFSKVRIDGKLRDLKPGLIVDRFITHNIEIVIDRITINEQSQGRLKESMNTALIKGGDAVMILSEKKNHVDFFSTTLMDPDTGLSYEEPAPNAFSFNSPFGSCPSCNGIGHRLDINKEVFFGDVNKPIFKGAFKIFEDPGTSKAFQERAMDFAKSNDISTSKPWKNLSPTNQKTFLYGFRPIFFSELMRKGNEDVNFFNNYNSGVVTHVISMFVNSTSEKIKSWAEQYVEEAVCPECNGARLKKESLHFKIDEKNIFDVSSMDMKNLKLWLDGLKEKLTPRQKLISEEIIKELRKRVQFLLDVGLDYLHLHRATHSLSGGEAQRIRLATQIGSQLVGVLYILDEPSIGLHQRDNERLINSLKNLRDLGNSILVVEHDKDMMNAADYIVDIGPAAGIHGGKVIAAGTPAEFIKQGSITAQFLNGERKINIPDQRRQKGDRQIIVRGCEGHNLKNITLEVPLGLFVCVTGVSGSGKSSLINQTLYPILHKHVYKFHKPHLKYESVEGLEYIDKIIEIDQKPIGRTPRSNPATYTGLFTYIRDLYSNLPESAIRGYQPGRFSFNLKGGRCETCEGAGIQVIEMNFLPDVNVQCPDCRGKRYNRETLEVRYKGRSISDVLNMTVSEGVQFFAAIPNIKRKLETLEDVGLGYISIGQSATTLSGGEAQRMKIATELSKKSTGKTFYILDEPTTGLHFQDVDQLLNVLNRLVGKGNTVLVIEHNLDVIKVADWIIDVGPEGGKAGGEIIVSGPPEEIINNTESHTAKFLKNELEDQTEKKITAML